MLTNDPNKRFEFQDRKVTPVMTAVLIFTVVLMYSISHGLLGPTKPEGWLMNNCYSLPKATGLLLKKDYAQLATICFNTTFGSFHLVQMALNMYFLWVFGKHVEVKLGPRYIILVTLGIFVPMLALHYDMSRTGDETVWVGTAFLCSTIIGTYMVFPPVPKSKVGDGRTMQAKNQIFRKGGRPDPLEKYTANPYMFVVTFLILQMGMHYWITLKKPFYFFDGMPGFDVICAIPCVVGAIIGYCIGQVLESQATAALKESPMTLSAVKRYHELIDLDVTHEDALRGTARTLGVPYEKVKQWVAKNKGSMRIK